MREETESQQQEDSYLVRLRRRALFRDASSTMTIAESLRELGVSGYLRRLERQLKSDGYTPFEYGAFIASERAWAETILRYTH